MSWFLLCLLSVFALGIAEITQQYLLNTKNPIGERTSLVLTFLLQAFFSLPFIFLSAHRGEFLSVFQQNVVVRLMVVTMVAAVAMVFYLKSFKVKNISISTIFIALSTVVSTTLGIMFFHETAYFLKFFGIGLILAAIISLNIRNIHLERNHFYGLLAGLLFGICYVLDKSIVESINPMIYLFWAFFLVAAVIMVFDARNIIKDLKGRPYMVYMPVLASAVGYFIYNLCTYFAYKLGGEVGRIDAINNSQVFIIILFEYIVLRQKASVVRKVLTALLAYIGVAILGFL